jgi:hypothetical protein
MERAVVDVLADVQRWARSRPDVRGVALVGSHASGKARPDSDVDLMIVTDAPEAYRNGDWVTAAVAGRGIAGMREEAFGNAWSLFVRLAQGLEIEFTFAGPAWASTSPPRQEVCGIVRQGLVILHDPLGELDALSAACRVNA